MSISTTILVDLQNKIEELETSAFAFRDEIIKTDADKEKYDDAINRLDRYCLTQVDTLNQTLEDVKIAYQERINVGCRTDMFWRIVGIDTTTAPTEYTLMCTKMKIVGFNTGDNSGFSTFNPAGLGTLGIDGLPVVTGSGSTFTIVPYGDPYGFEVDNYWGIKYYNEPGQKDIGDTTVTSFIGTVGLAQTVLTIMLPGTEVTDILQSGDLIVSSQQGIFSGEQNTVVGFGTTTADLSPVGFGTTTVSTVIMSANAIGIASAPQNDGSFVYFTIVRDPVGITTLSDYSIPFGDNPFSPQTIGILNSGNIGIGKSVFVVNNGQPPGPQSWKPEYEISGVDGIDDYVEPPVGAGKIYYPVGFSSAPVLFGGAPAVEGSIRIVSSIFLNTVTAPLGSCASEESALSAAISTRDTAESNFNSGITTFNSILNTDTLLRSERTEKNLKIHGLRTMIGHCNEQINIHQQSINAIGSTTIIELLS